MSGFHDVSLPGRFSLGAVGGPQRNTEVLMLSSGREVRNAVWAHSRRRWDLGGAVSDLSDLYELTVFFEARQGRLNSFRFRDPIDFSSAGPGAPVSASDQILGLGDGTTTRFSVVKHYGQVRRPIAQPDLSTLQVAIDDVIQASGWVLDTQSGEIVFDSAPLSGEVVSAGFEFDCVVRFETDQFNAVIEAFGAGRIASIELVEVI